MQRNNTFLSSCLTFIAFSISGIALGFFTGIIAAGISYTSALASWELLDSSVEFSQIIDVTSQTVWTQSVDEQLYSWNFICYGGIQCKQWVETSEVPDNIHYAGEQPMEKSAISCQAMSSGIIKEPPGKLVECAHGSYSGPEYGQSAYYALLDDGEIWALQTHSSLIEATVLPIIYSIGGFVLSIIVLILFVIIRKRKDKAQVNAEIKQ